MVVEPEILGLVFYALGFDVTLTSICLPYYQPPLYFSHPYIFVATPKPRFFFQGAFVALGAGASDLPVAADRLQQDQQHLR